MKRQAKAIEGSALAKGTGLGIDMFERVGRSNGQLTDMMCAYLAAHKLRTGLTVLGVVLGVAAMIALRLLNESASRSFAEATERIAGRTALEIHNGEAGVPGLQEVGDALARLLVHEGRAAEAEPILRAARRRSAARRGSAT